MSIFLYLEMSLPRQKEGETYIPVRNGAPAGCFVLSSHSLTPLMSLSYLPGYDTL